jgi:hypothetical protein
MFPRVPAKLKLVAGPLAALSLLLSVQGCGTDAAATTSPTGPTPAAAAQVFNAYVTTQKVALADHNELLALSQTTNAAYQIVSAQFATAAASGAALPVPVYGRPAIYVPKVTSYPQQWFVAVAAEHPATGGPSRTAMMVFYRRDAKATWALTQSVLLGPGVAPPKVTTDSAGYATAVSIDDKTLKVRPSVVGPLHATVADDGPSSAATAAIASGPETTGLYAANAALAHQAAGRKQSYQWILEGTSNPTFALQTAGGGALVFYTMWLNTTTAPINKPPKNSTAPLPVIPVPAGYRPLMATQAPIHHSLTAYQMLQYAAIDPPASASAPKIQVIGSGGGPTYAHGY